MQSIKWAANQRIEASHDATGVMFHVRVHGDKAELAGEIKLANVHPDVVSYAARDGLKKRVNDACAAAENNEQRFAVIKRLCDHYNSGAATWRLESVAASAKRLDRSAMYRAIATVRNMDVAHVEAKLREKDDNFLRSYNAIASIAAEYARLTTVSAPTETEDALFATLDE